MRRELPLDGCKIFRARNCAREFRFCVMPFSEVFRARCRFASRINSSKTSKYVKQPISTCKSLQTVRCLLELEHGYGCSEILPGLLVHLHVGKRRRGDLNVHAYANAPIISAFDENATSPTRLLMLDLMLFSVVDL